MVVQFKVGFSPSKNFFICFNESPLTIMKNAFYFISKTHSVLKIFYFDFLAMQKKMFDQKDKVNFRSYDVTTSYG